MEGGNRHIPWHTVTAALLLVAVTVAAFAFRWAPGPSAFGRPTAVDRWTGQMCAVLVVDYGTTRSRLAVRCWSR